MANHAIDVLYEYKEVEKDNRRTRMRETDTFTGGVESSLQHTSSNGDSGSSQDISADLNGTDITIANIMAMLITADGALTVEFFDYPTSVGSFTLDGEHGIYWTQNTVGVAIGNYFSGGSVIDKIEFTNSSGGNVNFSMIYLAST